MRIAFITPEFVTDYRDGGGLGAYLHRVGRLLAVDGHEVEIFVTSNLLPRVLEFEGMRVERVPPLPWPWNGKMLRRAAALAHLKYPFELLAQAHALARALAARERVAPFDFVQSADYLGVGLLVRPRPGRRRLVRCSSAADLYNMADGRDNVSARWRERFERLSIRRADSAYAPSALVASHYGSEHHIPVEVLRPPMEAETAPAADEPCGLPDRFLIHFGQLNRRKGTYWLIEALKLAFEAEPSLRMVWVGRANFEKLSAGLNSLGPHRSKLQVCYPMPKPELFAVLARAEAAVLPSLVDNLPNTVIESLLLGIPVIGTRGASIDELVRDGINGELVESADAKALAGALVRVWRGESQARKGFVWRDGVTDEMQPQRALANLLELGLGKRVVAVPPPTELSPAPCGLSPRARA